MSRRITPHDVQRYDFFKYAVIIALMLLMTLLIVVRELTKVDPDGHTATQLFDQARLWVDVYAPALLF